MSYQQSLEKNLQREKDFHDERYLSESENRKATDKYYRLKKDFDQQFLDLVIEHATNKKVLEIGCGPSINMPHWVDRAQECHGIDISTVAIDQAWERLGRHYDNVHLKEMNAETMDYEDSFFDVVCGKGIIHHLNPPKAFQEIARVLKPEGLAVFIEPLGHNPIINTYRRFTPEMRSKDETPLLMSDIYMASKYFENAMVDYQHITSILSAFIPESRLHKISYSLLNGVDKLIMTVLPFSKRYCWMALIRLQKPLVENFSN